MSTGHSHKPLSTPIRGINLDRFSSFAPQEYPNKFGIPFGLSSVVRLPVAVPSGLLTQPHKNGIANLPERQCRYDIAGTELPFISSAGVS